MSLNINCRKIRDGIAKSYAYVGGLPATCPVEGWEYAEFRLIKKGDWFIYKSVMSDELAVGQWTGHDGKWNDPAPPSGLWYAERLPKMCRKLKAKLVELYGVVPALPAGAIATREVREPQLGEYWIQATGPHKLCGPRAPTWVYPGEARWIILPAPQPQSEHQGH